MHVSINLTMAESRVMEKALQRSLDQLRDKFLAISNLLGEPSTGDVEFKEALQRAQVDVSKEMLTIRDMLDRL